MVDKASVLRVFSHNLKNKISVKQCSQEEIAKLLDVSQGTVSNWCRGDAFPSLLMAMEIANLFDTTVSELFGEVDAETYENSRYHLDNDFRMPSIDNKELESMEYLHDKGIIDDEKFYGYIMDKLKEIAE